MALPIVKVYAQDGSIIIDMGNGVAITAAPVNLVAKYIRRLPSTIYDDRVSLFVVGQQYVGFQDKLPDTIRDQNGDKLVTSRAQTIDDVEDYFTSLGIGQSSGGSVDLSDYYTKEQVQAGFVSLSQFNTYVASQQTINDQIFAAIGVTQLDSPTLIAGTPTENSVPLVIGSVANATSYVLSRDGEVIYTGVSGMYNATGLAPDTEYTFSAVSKGTGFIDSAPTFVTITTAGGITPPQNTLPYTLPFILS